MELLDMNDDCLELVLKCCDADSLVAASQTCKKLQSIATPMFKFKTSYECEIKSKKHEQIVKRTISSIGNHLTELLLKTINRAYGGVFYRRLSYNCPNLRKLNIIGYVLPNVVFGSILALKQLENLSVNRSIFALSHEYVDIQLVMDLARELKQLQFLEVNGVEWYIKAMGHFFREAENLKTFSGDIWEKTFKVDQVFFEKFKSSENPMRILDQELVDQEVR